MSSHPAFRMLAECLNPMGSGVSTEDLMDAYGQGYWGIQARLAILLGIATSLWDPS